MTVAAFSWHAVLTVSITELGSCQLLQTGVPFAFTHVITIITWPAGCAAEALVNDRDHRHQPRQQTLGLIAMGYGMANSAPPDYGFTASSHIVQCRIQIS